MSAPARTAESRGTVVIEIERCKGCELCIPACPPAVLHMSSDRNVLGVRYPELSPGCTGCGACLLVCPDFCFEVYQFDAQGRDAQGRDDEGRGAEGRERRDPGATT